MDSLVKRFKDFYTSQPFYQFQWSIYDKKSVMSEAELRQEFPWLTDLTILPEVSPMPPPLTTEQIEWAEHRLGFRLPSLLRELYMELSNGGFGPHILGLDGEMAWRDGFQSGFSAVEWYLYNYDFCANEEESLEDWNKLLKERLPIGYGGCQSVYLLDCRVENGPVLQWECSGLAEDMGWDILADSLSEWLERWLDSPHSMTRMY